MWKGINWNLACSALVCCRRKYESINSLVFVYMHYMSLWIICFYCYWQAIRKAPQHSAIGFRQTSHKFVTVVQLLLGEIPDRSIFREPILRKPLMPYFKLTQGNVCIATVYIDMLERYTSTSWSSKIKCSVFWKM